MIKTLETLGHSAYDWTSLPEAIIERPYQEEAAQKLAEAESAAIATSDAFVIIGDHSGTGMYVELGIALATGAKIYSIGINNDATVFHFLPSVIRLNTFEEVLADLGK